MTVCPPYETFTFLNYDLVAAHNMTLAAEVREELVLLSRARLAFHQITAYCSKLGGEMTRLRDAATVARLRPRLQLVASICGDSFYRSSCR